MDNEPIYIKPDITFYASFDEAFSDDSEYVRYLPVEQKQWEFTDFFRFPKTFVVAEPGYGKTELLRQIVSNAQKEGKNAIVVEIKKIEQSSVEEFIVNQAEREDVHKSDGFELKNEENIVVCLDALDEMKPQDFLQTVERIKTFLTELDNIIVIISCRRHSFDKHKRLFGSLKFRYARIFPFSPEQVNSYLEPHFTPQNDVNRIFGTPSFDEKEIVIQTPRYLKLLVNYIKDKRIENVTTLTKAELFEYFIYKKLEIEDEKLNRQRRDLIKRVLEKLALIMEIYQTNLLKKDELISFFLSLQDLRPSIVEPIPLEVFFENTLLKDNLETIEFDNTEFQEYLAAKEISRLCTNIRRIFDLAVDPEIREIYPDWFNPLGFVVDLDISILKPLLDFGQRRKEGITQDEDYHRLLTRVHVERLSLAVRKQIFEQVFSYYQSVLHWIPWDVAKKLAYYFDTSQHTLLKKHIDGRRFNKNETRRSICLGNVAQIVGLLIERGVFEYDEKAYWKQKLLHYAQGTNENLQVHALSALRHFKDDTILEEVKNLWDTGNARIRDAVLRLCFITNPNHPVSIHYFIKGVRQHPLIACNGLYHLTEANALSTMLDSLIEDTSFRYWFLTHEHFSRHNRAQFIEHLEAAWNDGIERKLQLLIHTVFLGEDDDHYRKRKSSLIQHLIQLLKRKEHNYIFCIVEEIVQFHDPAKPLFYIEVLFGILLEKVQVNKFVHQLSQSRDFRRIAFRTFQHIKNSDRPDAEEMYEAGRQYFIDEYKKVESRVVNQKEEPSQKEQLYHEFRELLEIEEVPGVFQFYLSHKEVLEPLLPDDEARIRTFIADIFENFDLGRQNLTITKEENGKREFIAHFDTRLFGDCIEVAKELSLNIEKYRQNIINYIPFAYQGDLEAIFSLVDNIQHHELLPVLQVYQKEHSNLRHFMPENLIEISKRYTFKEAVPILREFVEQEDFSIYDRIDALETAELLRPNANFLSKIFEQNRNNREGSKALTEKANALLITNHQDEAAIAWRFDELLKRAFPFREQTGVHQVSLQERELIDKNFPFPLMNLENPAYQDRFLNLLEKSFDLIKKDEYEAYAKYLWQIVCAYFDNLKKERTYRPLKKLEVFVQDHSSTVGLNWFQYELKKLKRSYLRELGKPTSINECILKYNDLKTRQYLKIATPDDLFETVKEIINEDLRQWVEDEGAYRFIVGEKIKEISRQDYEDLIQKTIKTQFENAFLSRGFQKQDIRLIREAQLLDDRRVDFLIYYGFIGPILVEIKLATSKDLKSKRKLEKQTSYKRLQQYMKGYSYNPYFGIFLVFDNKQRTGRAEKWETHRQRITEAYERIENVKVIGLACSQS